MRDYDVFLYRFIGEESVAAGAPCELTDAPTWIIDPVDGTMNFVHSLPFTAVSIGLYVNKEPVLGIVYNPILDRLYSAKKGQGAYLNGERIYTSGQKGDNNRSTYSRFHYLPRYLQFLQLVISMK